MMFNFTHQLSVPRYWIEESEGRKAILGKKEDIGQILGYQKYRLAYRSIASNTNERTLICTIIPVVHFRQRCVGTSFICQIIITMPTTSTLGQRPQIIFLRLKMFRKWKGKP